MLNGITTLNNFSTTLAAPLAAADTTGTLANIAPLEAFGDGFRGEFATPGQDATESISSRGRGILLTLSPAEGAESLADLEIIFLYQLLNASDVQDLLFVRAQEGTTAKDWPVGTIVTARHTAGMFNDIIKKNADGRFYIEILTTSYQYPAIGADGETGFNDTINICPSNLPIYGDNSVNIGTGGAGDTANDVTQSDDMINIGRGAVYSYGDGNGSNNSINVGGGSAGGASSLNFGSGGSGPFSINMGPGGAFPGATNSDEGSINIGGLGAYEFGAINIGGYTQAGTSTGPVSVGAITIGRDTSAGAGAGVAIGLNANSGGFSAGVALGAETATTANDQVHGGDRDLELGSGTSQRGVHLYSPDGTRYRLTVENGGTVTATADPIV